MNLILIGFKRSGKTTVGKQLATALKRPFIDTDEFICHSYGMSCADIYKKIGAEAFRQLEDEWLARIARTEGTIIALGGGSLRANPVLKGKYLYLKLEENEVKKRLTRDPRPRFLKDFDAHYKERSAIYNQYCDYAIDPADNNALIAAAKEVLDGGE